MTALPAPRLLDQFGRVGRDLRVSVTDRCNLRCTYCMPAEGLDWMPKPEMLSDDELVRVVSVMVGLGVTQVRLTGGEPILRRSLVDVVARIAALDPRPRIAMTTNGIGLDRLAAPLAAGTEFPAALVFEKAGEVPVVFKVEPRAPGAAPMGQMDHSGHMAPTN